MRNETKKITTISILSALGMVLMLIEIPYFIPGLNFDISDVVVLVVFMMYGWREALLVGVIKAIIHALIKPAFGPLYIGEITAVMASSALVLGMWISVNKFQLKKYYAAVVSVLVVTVLLTTMNYLFVTPMWTVFFIEQRIGFATFNDIRNYNVGDMFGLSSNLSYLGAIVTLFVPFNLIKGTAIFLLFVGIQESLKSYLENNY